LVISNLLAGLEENIAREGSENVRKRRKRKGEEERERREKGQCTAQTTATEGKGAPVDV
jgi:hypothetical protein